MPSTSCYKLQNFQDLLTERKKNVKYGLHIVIYHSRELILMI